MSDFVPRLDILPPAQRDVWAMLDRVPDADVLIASLLDLAATKMASVQNRSEAKDYQDIHALLNAGLTLEQMLAAAVGVYGPNFNAAVTLKALVYFEDGDLPGLSETVRRQLTDAAVHIGTIPAPPTAQDRLEA